MALTLYELLGKDDRRLSPYCWRIRMALAHKGLAADIVPCRFTEKEKFAFSGQERVPVLTDGDTTVYDSWTIANYLEDAYPDRPSLFGGAVGRGVSLFVNSWCDRALHLSMIGMIVKDIHDHIDPVDHDYFRASREKRLGGPLEEVQARARETGRPALDAALATFTAVLRDQPFLSGATPAYPDYILFGAFQWARSVSDYAIVAPESPVAAWRGRMLGLFDGLGRSVPAYPV